MSQPLDDAAYVELWRAGNEGAARQLFEAYAEKLMALARPVVEVEPPSAIRADPEERFGVADSACYSKSEPGLCLS